MPYLLFSKKRQNLKVSSAANYMALYVVLLLKYTTGTSFVHKTSCLVMLSADNLCKLFGSRVGKTNWQHIRPDLDPNCLTLWWYIMKKFFLSNFSEENYVSPSPKLQFESANMLTALYCVTMIHQLPSIQRVTSTNCYIHLRIEMQIFSLHWMMQNIRLFNVCEARRASRRH